MKFLQVHTFYNKYLADHYARDPKIAALDFQAQIETLLADGFSASHMFVPYMRDLGYEAQLIIANCAQAQQRWAIEAGALDCLTTNWMFEITRRQVEFFKPDILYLSDPILFDSRFVRALTWRPRLVLGWRAASIPPETDWTEFDLMLSHLKSSREQALRHGAKAVTHFFPGFPRFIAERIANTPKQWDVVFSGQWTPEHGKRNAYLHRVFEARPGTESEFSRGLFLAVHPTTQLPSQLEPLNQGPRWGMEMYQALRSGNIVLNAEIDLAKGEAGNMRAFETTGVGSFLLTERHSNLQAYFEPGRELETFNSEDELFEKIQYYLANPQEREAIAARGQQRCLNDYSMERRAEEFHSIIQALLAQPAASLSSSLSSVIDQAPMLTVEGEETSTFLGQIDSLMADGHHDQALAAIQEGLTEEPASVSLLQRQALTLYVKGDMLRTKKTFEQILSLRPTDLDALISLGDLNLSLHDVEGAHRYFSEAFRLAPQDVDAAVGLALSATGKQDLATLETAYHRLMVLDSSHPRLEEISQSIRQLSASGDSSPLPDDLLDRALACLNNERNADALQILETLSLRSDAPAAIEYGQAVALARLDRKSDATLALHRLLSKIPHHRKAYRLLSELEAGDDSVILSQPTAALAGDREFAELYDAVRPYTMLSVECLFSLYSLTKRVCQENLPGNFVECGVAGGGSSALIAAVIKRYSAQPRFVFAVDSFEGRPELIEANPPQGAEATDWETGAYAASESSLLEICAKLGVSEFVKPIKGDFEHVLLVRRDWFGMIAFLHMDGELYSPTKAMLDHLYERIVGGGLIQVDDYGCYEGCRNAVHEFEAAHELHFELHSIDGTGVWFAKPDRTFQNPAVPRHVVEAFSADDPVRMGLVSQMSPNERFQLHYLLHMTLSGTAKPVRFVEIGSYGGASLLQSYLALKRTYASVEGYAVDPACSTGLQTVLQHTAEEITYLQMFSQDAAPLLQQVFATDGNYPEFILVDGDHSYEGVYRDILHYYPLLKPGGVMMFHDFLPPIDDKNREPIFFHHGGKDPGIRQACEELMEKVYHAEVLELPLLYPEDPTQTQAHLPIIPGVFSTIRAYRKPR